MMKPSLADAIQDSRPVSGTEIEADSLTYTEEDDIDFVITEEDEDPDFAAPSPMQRLTEMARDSPRASPPKEDEIEAHHDKLRAFLASSHASDTPTTTITFPAPPGNRMSARQSSARGTLSPLMPEEMFMPPEVPERSPNRTPMNQPRNDPKQPTTPRHPLPHLKSSDLLVEIESALPLGSKLHEPDHVVPGLYSTPRDFQPGRTVSPSVATSQPSPLTPNLRTRNTLG